MQKGFPFFDNFSYLVSHASKPTFLYVHLLLLSSDEGCKWSHAMLLLTRHGF